MPSKNVLVWTMFIANVLTVLLVGPSTNACDTWLAMHDATEDGSVLLGKNSDRPPMEAQPLVLFPRTRHASGDRVKCTYIEIPQVDQTYEHIGSKIWWTFGYEHGMNEHGVAIGNEAVWSKEPYQWGDGLLGMDMLRLALERGTTGFEAMHVIIDLLQRYGQCGDAEHQGEWGQANYHNSFIIADPDEAWILETAGKFWVAKKITKGVYSISNIYTIEDQWDEAHPNLVKHAIEQGWTKNRESFNFARDYGDYWRKDAKNPGNMQIRRNQTLACLNRDITRISPASMMAITRSHHEGTVVGPRWGAAEAFWATPCMHDTPQSPYRSAASIVAHLRTETTPLLRQVYWASFSNPCCSVFKPFYLHGPKLPPDYALGTSDYSSDSPWWWANRVKLLCDLNYRALHPRVRSIFDRTEQWEMQRQKKVESQAAKLIQQGEETAATQLVQRFVDENCARVEKEYEMLNNTLPRILQRVGTEYVFLDYLKEWTSRKAVPLPVSQP